MSTEAQDFVSHLKVEYKITLQVLRAVAHHIGVKSQVCTASHKTLAEWQGLTEETVRRHLDVAEERGWISRTARDRRGVNGSRTGEIRLIGFDPWLSRKAEREVKTKNNPGTPGQAVPGRGCSTSSATPGIPYPTLKHPIRDERPSHTGGATYRRTPNPNPEENHIQKAGHEIFFDGGRREVVPAITASMSMIPAENENEAGATHPNNHKWALHHILRNGAFRDLDHSTLGMLVGKDEQTLARWLAHIGALCGEHAVTKAVFQALGKSTSHWKGGPRGAQSWIEKAARSEASPECSAPAPAGSAPITNEDVTWLLNSALAEDGRDHTETVKALRKDCGTHAVETAAREIRAMPRSLNPSRGLIGELTRRARLITTTSSPADQGREPCAGASMRGSWKPP